MQHQCLYCGELHPPEDTCVAPLKGVSREEVLAIHAKPQPLNQQRSDPPNLPAKRSASASPIVVVSNPLEDTVSDYDEDRAREAALMREASLREHRQPDENKRLPTLLGVGDKHKSTPNTKPTPPPPSQTITDINESTIGSFIGEYELISFLGEGGMGRVYRARHARDGSEVAIKILKPEVAHHDEAVRRFFREAQVVDGVQHPNVIDIVDLGRTRYGEYFLLMELLHGEPLRVAIETGAPFSSERIAHITHQLCSALHACHQKGVAHRDLKSDNIFLITKRGQRDFVKVLDFGLAKLYKSNAGIDAAPMVSAPGMVLGTPVCMSPEQALGEEIDQQTDIYALGVLLYQMATGHLPFFDPNPIVLLKLHLTTEAIRPSTHVPSLNKSFEAVILRCLEKPKQRRYRSAEEVARAIHEALPTKEASPSHEKKPISNAVLFLLAASTFIAALLLTWLFNALMS